MDVRHGGSQVFSSAIGFSALFAACLCASDATAAMWIGGSSGDIAEPANWDGDITATAMVFTNDVNLTLSTDTAVYNVLTNYSSKTIPAAARGGRTIVFDMGGNTLRSYGKPNTDGNTMWHLGNSIYRFTNGTFLNVSESGSVTNYFRFENANMGLGTIEVTGANTKFVSGYSTSTGSAQPGSRLKVLNGAEVVGTYFAFSGLNLTNEVSGGSVLRYDASVQDTAHGMCVGGRLDGYHAGGGYDVLTISGEGSSVEPIAAATTNANFFVGYGGKGGSKLIVKDGASLTVPKFTAVGHGGYDGNKGIDYSSHSNELVVTGSGSTLENHSSNSDFPVAIGRRGSYNRLLVDNGATARMMALSCGGDVKANLWTGTGISVYTSICNVVTIDNGSFVDAGCISVGNQHSDSKKLFAQYGPQGYSNRVEVLGGSTLYATNGQISVGCLAPYYGNVLSISGAGTKARLGKAYSVMVGLCGSSSNRFEVLDGASVELVGSFQICNGHNNTGWGYASDGETIIRGIGNEFRVEGAGSSVTNMSSSPSMYFGGITNGNSNVVWVGDGATFTWPGPMIVAGYDNKFVVSNGTFNLTFPVISTYNKAENYGGRTRFVFAGAAPKLISTHSYQSKFQCGAVLRFEVPASGWSEAPLQIMGASSSPIFDDDTTLEVNVRAYARVGGGEVPVITSVKTLSISDTLLSTWNADLAERRASVRLSDDKKTLLLNVTTPGLTVVVR